MMKRTIALWTLALCLAWTVWAGEGCDQSAFSLTSPDGRLAIGLDVRSEGLMWSLKLDFLGEGAWTMRVFADDPAKTPADAKAIRLEERVVTKDEAIAVSLCNEGGAVVILEKIGTR